MRALLHKLQGGYSDYVMYRLLIQYKSKPLVAVNEPAFVVAAHQDENDETFACGELIVLKREDNIPVRVVFSTEGRHGSACTKQIRVLQVPTRLILPRPPDYISVVA